MIKLNNVVKSFGESQAVRGVSFTIPPGEITGYLGPNGAGKSTTVKMISGVLAPTSGTIEVAGIDVQQHPLEVKRRIGLAPESQALYLSLTANEYLTLVAELHEIEPALARERITGSLELFGLAHQADRLIETYSKGMRQKILIIAALLHDPEVILFDEPLNGLDVNSVLIFHNVMQGLAQRGKTILYCSHVLDVVERICSRIIVLHEGQVVADQPTAELLSGHPSGRLEEVFRQLTRREDVPDEVGGFLDLLDRKTPAATLSQK